jgi:glycine/D-amino acid oxidase-like deaminating enzyme
VVVGAGIIGASIAHQLSRWSVSATVLDSNEPGGGASSHSFAWINATGKSPDYYHEFSRRSMEMWSRFARMLDADLGLTWGGYLQWESTPEGAARLRARLDELHFWGYPCRIINEQEIHEVEPGIVTGPVLAAALNEVDGHIDPQKVVDVCLLRAVEAGAVVHRNRAVTGFSTVKNSESETVVEGVITGMGDIGCDAVVLAAGVGTTALAAKVGISIPQQYSPGVVVKTDPLPPLLQTVSVVYAPQLDSSQSEIHLRQMADGSVQIGEGSQESLSRDDSQGHANDLLARATRYLPALSGARIFPVPMGVRPMPRDGFPAIGFPSSAPNVYIALMHSGVTLAPLTSEMAAMEIVDGARVEALALYRPDRFLSGKMADDGLASKVSFLGGKRRKTSFLRRKRRKDSSLR